MYKYRIVEYSPSFDTTFFYTQVKKWIFWITFNEDYIEGTTTKIPKYFSSYEEALSALVKKIEQEQNRKPEYKHHYVADETIRYKLKTA